MGSLQGETAKPLAICLSADMPTAAPQLDIPNINTAFKVKQGTKK